MDYWQLIILIAILGFYPTNSLFVTNIHVPAIVDFRDRVTLSCSYNMGTHKLNSVKWYKDGKEFFRYSPMMHPVFMTFPVDGVSISNDKFFCNEVTCSIDLEQLGHKTTGSYRCEVSGDAPEFKLTSRTANMSIAALPQHDPLINGVSPTYSLDDFVIANCSSDWSSPPATLFWYINNDKAPVELLQPQQETTITSNGFQLRLRSLEIRFYLDRQRIINARGILRLKCVADINGIPSLSREKYANAVILSSDDLNNQKLVNWKNSAAKCLPSLTFLLQSNVILLLVMYVIKNIQGHMIR